MSTAARTLAFEKPWDVRRLEDCYFYHTLDLPDHGVVQGEWDLRGRFDDYIGKVDVRGKSVLDIGTASGFLSFEAEKRGAAEVVSFDISDAKYQHLVPFKDNLYHRDHERWRALQTAGIERWKNGYWLAHRLYNSRAKVFYGNIYDLPPGLGTFDVVILGSVLEHLSDPVSALGSVARLVGSTLVVATYLVDTEERIAYFQPSADKPSLDYTWWVYSMGTFREVLDILGFKIDFVTRDKFPCGLQGGVSPRHIVVASRR